METPCEVDNNQSSLHEESLGERVLHTMLDDSKKDIDHKMRMARRKAMLRAVYAEFFGTIFFLLPIFATLVNNRAEGYTGAFNRMSGGLVAGIGLVCMIMCFSSLSGAIFNPAITFSLWVVGKLSNRKCVFFMAAQMLASIVCMLIIHAAFPTINVEVWEFCVVSPPPGASSWNVFFTEFVTTFILTYCAFAMAFEEAESLKSKTMSFQAVEESRGLVVFGSTPQSKVGFAPFAIGFVVFALSQFGGGSGTSMNPARMFGPAIFADSWDSWLYYMLGEFLGATAAGFLVVHGPQSGERHNPEAAAQSNINFSKSISGISSLPVVSPLAEGNL